MKRNSMDSDASRLEAAGSRHHSSRSTRRLFCAGKSWRQANSPFPQDRQIERSWKGATFSCLSGNVVLGAGIDPIALKDTIVEEVAQEFGKNPWNWRLIFQCRTQLKSKRRFCFQRLVLRVSIFIRLRQMNFQQQSFRHHPLPPSSKLTLDRILPGCYFVRIHVDRIQRIFQVLLA